MKQSFWKFFFLIWLVCISNASHALEVIEILGGKASQISVAVIPFKDNNAQKSMQLMHEVITNDLNRSGLFSSIDISGVSDYPIDEREVNFSNWAALQSQFIVVGKIDAIGRSNSQMQVTWSLIDIYKEKTVLSVAIKGQPSQYRVIAHRIADTIYEKLTGSKGVFDTNIAFVKKLGKEKYSLFIADYDGHNPRAIVNSRYSIISPRWSPNGKKIAYVSFEKKKPVIYVQDIETGKRTLLANFRGNNSAPAWSPDSKKLAIVLTYSANSQIYTIDADGKNIKQLMRTRSINTEPAWSPNGKEIYFSSDRAGSAQIYKVDVDTNEVVRVTFEGNNNVSPSLSPDGKLLLFLNQDNGSYRVAIQNLLSNQMLKLTNGPDDESPIFSPNGHMVLFTYKDYGKVSKIGTVSINGLKMTPIDVGSETILESTWGPLSD
ncbi:MAG: Tol-Pal system beta propeller repeat protein TolB [Betaproteobacteria bacterium]|nr:Tol-Pal system beta propeller repeat protein TolB [Betaproteobacteria bacterium]